MRARLPEPTAEALRLRNSVGTTPQQRTLPVTSSAGSLLTADPTNRYIFFAGVSSARLHRGFLSDRFAVVMKDGVRLKLLWLRVVPAYNTLRRELPGLLGQALGTD